MMTLIAAFVPKCHQQPANQIKRDLESAAALFISRRHPLDACRCLPELLRNFSSTPTRYSAGMPLIESTLADT